MSSEFAPRLCHLVKWPDFDGYGFNLHAEKSRSGQYIGKVDRDSPAELAGLREGDRIVEVNGVNIAQENHRQVVERIKSISGETRLLVVDPESDRHYREQKVVVKSTMPSVLFLKTPVPRPSKEPPSYMNVGPENPPNGQECETQQQNGHSNGSGALPSNGTHEKPVAIEVEEKSSPEMIKGKVLDSPLQKTKEEEHTSRSSTPMDGGPASVPDSPQSTKSSHSVGGASNGGPTSLEDGMLNLNMSASEMRQMLANRRKKDPKKEQIDIRQKYEIIQQM